MINIPMIHVVLVVPHDLPCIRVQRERRVVIQVLEIISGEHELWRWSGHGRTNVEHVQFGIVARNHPGPDVSTLFVRESAPRLIAGLSTHRYRTRAPKLLAGLGIMRNDDTCERALLGLTAPARKDLSFRDDRT